MGAPIKTFLVEPIKVSRYYLRRYSSKECAGRYRYHNAHGEVIAETNDDPKQVGVICTNPPPMPDKTDIRWPSKCDHCDYRFEDTGQRQVFGEPLFKRVDNGAIFTKESLPAGAIWESDWGAMFNHVGDDGKSYYCRLPDGVDWNIDGPCSNCTRKGEPHHCWPRHGVAPDFTVDKNGNTCSAGAGSIATGSYHGFLRNGYLEEC